ncbi:hypothetical protein PHYSODRAFT_348084 [Phytophthora sojae]|uniref:Uncharacterized protein n=1 Tax=Phytophthora sojae (strain P6497) TaxID=1094619 RepID=G5A7J3_PHYSP|nr:hypothetical protein PHYSODRAFT_348084 [Phytophthora sojae]EGZ08567.1 hypothetical protein PHYSODRAFT_348084 [Phytophthora sojae]|eukprot:XP_009536739.1 hypothetical protein PHYSODRAFT_348084 [Phytophthora sojae]
MFTEVASLVAEFVVPGVGEVVVAALGTVGKLVTEMKENEEMCKRVLKRMTSVHKELLRLKDDKVLREQNETHEEIQDFHLRMDDLFKLLNLTHIAEMSKWKQEWEEDKKLAMQERADILANNQAMKEEIHRMGNKIEEGIAQLVPYNKVVSLSKAKVPVVPAWYIPRDEVDFDLQECFDLGFYGSVQTNPIMLETEGLDVHLANVDNQQVPVEVETADVLVLYSEYAHRVQLLR